MTPTPSVLAPLGELVASRKVLVALVRRDLAARYRGSALGFLWTFLNPLLLMGIYSLVFAVYIRVDVPAYPVFVFAGLLPWLWFSTSLQAGVNAIVDGAALLRRVPFPPHALPLVPVTAGLVNFALTLPLLLGLVALAGRPITWAVLLLPIPVALLYLLGCGFAIGLAPLNVRYRDLHHLLGSLLSLWFFVTPVLYPASLVPAAWRPLLVLNPVAPIVVAMQDVLYRGQLPAPGDLGVAAVVTGVVVVVALAAAGRQRWRLVEEI